jgi:hypothetical protein
MQAAARVGRSLDGDVEGSEDVDVLAAASLGRRDDDVEVLRTTSLV